MHTEPKTEPSLFIVESLTFNDEKAERFEGRILNYVLRLARKEVRYFYIRTQQEFETVLDEFDESRMRYLHVCCHGNPDAVAFTLDTLSCRMFGDIVRPHLNHRRIFFSACGVVNNKLADSIIPTSGCYSLIGPEKQMLFDDAALMWASFYHLMFREKPQATVGRDIRSVLQNICDTFDIPFLYYRPSQSAPQGFKGYRFRKCAEMNESLTQIGTL